MTDSHRRLTNVLLLLVACLISSSVNADDRLDRKSMPAEYALARFALIGIQIETDRSTSAKVTPEVVRCVKAIQPEALMPTYRRILATVLSDSELAQTEAAYGGPLGEKILLSGEALVYRGNGIKPPGGDVAFSKQEDAELMKFVNTSAGNKLLKQNFLDQPGPSQLLRVKLNELATACLKAGGTH
jgi:hypothetical protein